MINAEDSQFTLREDGRICYQAKPNNPVPGQPVASVVKGPDILRPDVNLTEEGAPSGCDPDAVAELLKTWLHRHIDTVLEPLRLPEDEESVAKPVQSICSQLRDALGIVPRHVIEPFIAELDQEGRAALRRRKVKLGPVLVFIPALNKPAAVRLRALLWSLWNDNTLPAAVPADGIVSMVIDRDAADPLFFRAIGYPVYGPRAVRIDMLDRVINSVYDGAENGVFRAKHEMAEWLGCPILDLYEVLDAMGHRKLEESGKEQPQDSDKTVPEEQEKDSGEKEHQEGAQQEKPELAAFRLKKGRASERPVPPSPHKPRKKPDNKGKEKKKPHKTGRKPAMKAEAPAPRPEDSPFAILQQLKDRQ